jgi:hypothetical protein
LLCCLVTRRLCCAGFIDFIIKPAFEAWFTFMRDSTVAVEGMANLDSNRMSWSELAAQEAAAAKAEAASPAQAASAPATPRGSGSSSSETGGGEDEAGEGESAKVEQLAKEEAVA